MISIGNEKAEKAEIIVSQMIKDNLISKEGLFEITDVLLEEYINRYSVNFRKSNSYILRNSDKRFAKKLAGMTFIKLNKRRATELSTEVKKKVSISKLKFGFLYLISNPVFPGMYKVGMTQDLEKRLVQYQTCDPLRRYKIEHVILSEDRRKTEQEILSKFKIDVVNGEWIDSEKVKVLFKKGVIS
jgi:hypothetical protein